jgi:hypothetical protein
MNRNNERKTTNRQHRIGNRGNVGVIVEQPAKTDRQKQNMKKVIAAFNMTLDGFCNHTAGLPDEEIHQHYT